LTDGFESLFQDWADWTTQGYVDWVAPFAYSETKYQATALIGVQKDAVTNPAVQLYPGLQMGITNSTGLLDVGVATDQILAVRAAALTGLVNYGWQDIYETAGNLGPYLRSGPFRVLSLARAGSARRSEWIAYERRIKQSEDDVLMLLGTMCESGYFDSRL
jgi:uncharacterized lipoprotein YddW (UPF0748 family)